MMCRSAFAVLCLVVVACSPIAVETPSQPAAPAQIEASAADAPTTAAAAQRGSDAWCARSLCGCWEDATLSFDAALRDGAGAPAAGVEAFCQGEEAPIAISDADGALAFEIATQRSPGCGYQRCRNIVMRDPQGRFAEKSVTAWTDGVITLEPASAR